MRKYLLLICVLIAAECNGQLSKWEVDIRGGLSVPVGKFANDNSYSAFVKGEMPNDVYGIQKSENGFAEIGWTIGMSVVYNLNITLGFSLYAGYNNNAVSQDKISNDLTEYTGLPTRYQQDNYQSFQLLFGPKFRLVPKGVQIDLIPLIGYSRLQFPHYGRYIAFNPPDERFIGQDDDENPLNALSWGGGISARYKFVEHFRIGLDLSHLRSDYSFTISNRQIPGGSGSDNYDDKIHYRLLTISLLVSYVF